MPPTVVAVGAVDTATPWVPGLPTGWAQNDILLIGVESTGGEAAPAATGYAHIDSVSPVVQGTNTQLSVLWKRATASESAPTVTGPTDHAITRMLAVRGCPTAGNPWNVVAVGTEATSDTSAAWPAATTTVADCLILFWASTSADIATAQFAALTGGSGLTNVVEQIDNAATTGNGGVLGCISATKATAGSTGSPTSTLTTAGFKAFMTLAMSPQGQRIQRPRLSFVPIDHAFRH